MSTTPLLSIPLLSTPPTPLPPPRKKLRIVCISDTHNRHSSLKIPPGDLLIHAGDLTNTGSHSELSKVVTWLSTLEHEYKLIIAGNHDGVTLDPKFHDSYHSYFHTQHPQCHMSNLHLLTSPAAVSRGIVYLNHQPRRLTFRDGRTIRVFGSPWSKSYGLWGFGYGDPGSLHESLWADIPGDTDILVTHGPPKHHLDAGKGCEYLRRAISTVRPLLHVFGHVHEARGVERVKWDVDSRWVRWKEGGVVTVEDRAPERAGKLWVVNLTKRGGMGIDNDGGEGKGRRETCLVNAAMVGSWREGAGHEGGRKAVCVDVEVGVGEAAAGGLVGEESAGEGMQVIEEE